MTKKKHSDHNENASDIALNLLDEMITKYFSMLTEKKELKPKLGDWLKMIELRRKLQPDEKPQAELWKKLDQVRQELLGESGVIKDNSATTKPSTPSRQIIRRKKEILSSTS